MKIGLVGGSYQEAMLPWDAQRSVNLFPAFDKEGKEVAALYSAPGKLLVATVGTGAIRVEFAATNGRAFAVSGSTLYEVFADGTSTPRGALDSSSGLVSIDENGFQLALCDGQYIYMFNYATNAYQKVLGLPAIGTIAFIDGFFVASELNTGRFRLSGLYDGLTWPALSFATAESSPDNLLRVYNAVGQLWLFGTKTTEIWTNTGASSFPYERISGAKMEVGILAPHTAIAIDNSILWVGRDGIGSGIVYRARGFSPQRISTNAIELIIQKATNLDQMRSYTYQEQGHTFYVLTGGGLGTTLVYDLSTQLWHERAYMNDDGFFEQDIGACCMYAFGLQLVGDRRNGNIYAMSNTFYSDAGRALCRERTYTHLGDEFKNLRYSSLVIGFETGVGLQDGQGSDPQVALQLSKDGARTWSNWYIKTFGKVGQYLTNVTFRRLGVAQQMTFKIRITDPVPVRICGSYLA